MENLNILLIPSNELSTKAIEYSQSIQKDSQYTLTHTPPGRMSKTESKAHITLLQFHSDRETALKIFNKAAAITDIYSPVISTRNIEVIHINEAFNTFWMIEKEEGIYETHEKLLSLIIDAGINTIYGDYGAQYAPHFTLGRHNDQNRASQLPQTPNSMFDRHLTLALGSMGADGQLQEIYEQYVFLA